MKKINVLINEEQINERLDELANQLMEEYKGKDLMFLCILKGSVFFTVELAKRIKNNIQFEFIEVSSYEGHESTGKIKLSKDITGSIEGKEVIIIEDIIDTGRTLSYLKEYLLQKNPASLKICSLLDKPSRRIVPIEGDYIGFTIENKFVIGYGLDDEQDYRNLNYIGCVEE
jgi:hypoxanthine phosphoribosyltransferase